MTPATRLLKCFSMVGSWLGKVKILRSWSAALTSIPIGKLARSLRAGSELQENAEDDALLEDAILEMDSLELRDEIVFVGAED